MNDIEKFTIKSNSSIKQAIQQMDKAGIGFIVVINTVNNVMGVISNGDFRRAVLNDISLEENVMKITNTKFKCLSAEYTEQEIENLFKNSVIQHIPIIKDNKLIDIITKEEFSTKLNLENFPKIHIPVVIMAGGKGERMKPITNILPKPLIPINEKPIIELIMDEFNKFGINDFYISINHKGKMIQAYFDGYKKYKINYINESKPLGTAGALQQLKGKISTPFFVSNCDIVIKDNYWEILEMHLKNKNELTLVASMQYHKIPYGVCEIEEGGQLKEIIEKPEYNFLINAGMYILNSSVLDLIPENTFFHITDLIKKLQKQNLKVGVFPVSEESWIDLGQWREYNNNILKITDV